MRYKDLNVVRHKVSGTAFRTSAENESAAGPKRAPRLASV